MHTLEWDHGVELSTGINSGMRLILEFIGKGLQMDYWHLWTNFHQKTKTNGQFSWHLSNRPLPGSGDWWKWSSSSAFIDPWFGSLLSVSNLRFDFCQWISSFLSNSWLNSIQHSHILMQFSDPPEDLLDMWRMTTPHSPSTTSISNSASKSPSTSKWRSHTSLFESPAWSYTRYVSSGLSPFKHNRRKSETMNRCNLPSSSISQAWWTLNLSMSCGLQLII